MPDIPIPPSVTQFYGPFNLKQLLSSIRGWIQDAGYEVIEPSYKHKVGGEGAELEIKMEGERKQTHYAKFKITVELKISDMKDVEVVRDGEKVKMQHGRIQATLAGNVELDFQKRFEGNKFLEGLRDFYHKYIIKETIENVYWDNVHTTIFKLQRFIRDSLQFEAK